MPLPSSWNEALDRLAYQIGGRSSRARAEADDWLREAVEATYGAESLYGLSRPQRVVCFQRLCGVVAALEEGEEAILRPDARQFVAAVFARYFEGAALEGPPWRLAPGELERPLYEDAADFD